MKLKVNDFAKIKNAEIEFDGITVIAGENNTGKSTIGKVVFTIFNSMNDMETKIDEERERTVFQLTYRLIQNLLADNGVGRTEMIRKSHVLARKFAQQVFHEMKGAGHEGIYDMLSNFMKENELEGTASAEFVQDMQEKLEALFEVSDEIIMKEVITRWYRDVFERQITPLVEKEPRSSVELEIKGKKVHIHFLNNECDSLETQINILYQAFYIDNPFAVDEMADRETVYSKATKEHLLEQLCEKMESPMDGIFDKVMVKEKLKEIYSMLDKVIAGQIVENSDGEYYLNSSEYTEPLNIKNLSAGLKSFAVVKQLLENGSLRERDILILDEPEIHLHPEWQLLYAELIVLLQRAFNLTLVITTHSPYFLDAIDIYTSKYGRADKVHYYLAENEGQMSVFHDVTNQIDLIYEKLSEPMQRLETMRNMYCTNEG